MFPTNSALYVFSNNSMLNMAGIITPLSSAQPNLSRTRTVSREFLAEKLIMILQMAFKDNPRTLV